MIDVKSTDNFYIHKLRIQQEIGTVHIYTDVAGHGAFQNFNSLVIRHMFDIQGFIKSVKESPVLYYVDGNGMDYEDIVSSFKMHWHARRSEAYHKNSIAPDHLYFNIEIIKASPEHNTQDIIKELHEGGRLYPYDVIAFSNISSSMFTEYEKTPKQVVMTNIYNKLRELAKEHEVVVMGYEQESRPMKN